MYKILAVQIAMVLQILCDESIPHYRTSGTKDLEVIQKEFLTIMEQAVETAIDHQQKNNATEPLNASELKEFREMLRTVNGTDLEDLQAQNMDAMRHGRLDMTVADMAKMFQNRKQQHLKLQKKAAKSRNKMQKRIDRWARKEERRAKKKARTNKEEIV